MAIITTTGFLDGMANYLEGLSDLGLTKGTNLFAENFIDDPDTIEDHFVLFDGGNEQVAGFGHIHLRWSVRILTTRKTRISAAESLRPILNELVNKRRFEIASDAGDKFSIIKIDVVGSPEITAQTETGVFAAQCIIQFQVIPR